MKIPTTVYGKTMLARRLRKKGWTNQAIADLLDLSPSRITQMCNPDFVRNYKPTGRSCAGGCGKILVGVLGSKAYCRNPCQPLTAEQRLMRTYARKLGINPPEDPSCSNASQAS